MDQAASSGGDQKVSSSEKYLMVKPTGFSEIYFRLCVMMNVLYSKYKDRYLAIDMYFPFFQV